MTRLAAAFLIASISLWTALGCGGGETSDPSDNNNNNSANTCTPTTCAAEGKNCGTISDGCSATLECGTCTSPQTCGGGGTANVCGVGSCTPTTCAAEGKDCDAISDGCSTVLECGTCTSPQTCGGGGTANVCGVGTCTPTTCVAEGKDCDTISDGCGNTLDCGTCTSPATCGGGGTTNVCGSTSALDHFSFFVTSYKAIQELSGSPNSFGGDLRYGETGAGAGLRGADKICSAIAEMSMPGSSAKVWRAFLSVTADENGDQVDAIDRIGNGPWYDRLGRLFANNQSELLYDRPLKANSVIKNDFPNEDGVPNHDPDGTGDVDNHDFLTGSDDSGQLYGSTSTCLDWTSSSSSYSGKPRVGHSWPTAGGFSWAPPGGGGDPAGQDMANWMSALNEAGCAARVYLLDNPPSGPAGCVGVGCGGGYGGIYCFALTP